MRKGVPVEEVLEAITGRKPEPIEITDPTLIQMRDEMGRARRAHQITTEEEWLKQLARFKNGANGNGNGDHPVGG